MTVTAKGPGPLPGGPAGWRLCLRQRLGWSQAAGRQWASIGDIGWRVQTRGATAHSSRAAPRAERPWEACSDRARGAVVRVPVRVCRCPPPRCGTPAAALAAACRPPRCSSGSGGEGNHLSGSDSEPRRRRRSGHRLCGPGGASESAPFVSALSRRSILMKRGTRSSDLPVWVL